MNNQHIQLTPDKLSNKKQYIAAIISSIWVSLFTVEVVSFNSQQQIKFITRLHRRVLINAAV